MAWVRVGSQSGELHPVLCGGTGGADHLVPRRTLFTAHIVLRYG